MIFFINKEKTRVIAFIESKQMCEVFDYAGDDNVWPKEKIIGKVLTLKPKTKERIVQMKKTATSKAGAIRELLEDDDTLPPKEIIEKLKNKYPTISPQDVYQMKAKLRGHETSDVFTGRGDGV